MFKCLYQIYYDGLRTMPRWAKIVCIIVLTKLFVMFIVFKLLLMPNYLNTNYTTDEEKSNCVLNILTNNQ